MTPPHSPLVLSLFPGIGLLDHAFELEGFCVVRGPDLLWGGDIKRFHPPSDTFEGVIGGPPCQAFSQMRHINPLAGSKHGNLIPEFERVVEESAPRWFLMENVKDAPIPNVPGYTTWDRLVKDVWVGGKTMRLRRFSFGTADGRNLPIEVLALHDTEPAVSALAGGGEVPVKLQRDGKGGHVLKKRYMSTGGRSSAREKLEFQLDAQGLPPSFLDESPFTMAAKMKVIGNGVPIPMGRAVARAVRRATEGSGSNG